MVFISEVHDLLLDVRLHNRGFNFGNIKTDVLFVFIGSLNLLQSPGGSPSGALGPWLFLRHPSKCVVKHMLLLADYLRLEELTNALCVLKGGVCLLLWIRPP